MATSSNTLVPSAAAKVSMRLAPDEDPREAFPLVRGAPRAHAPWGAEVDVHLDDEGAGFDADAAGPGLRRRHAPRSPTPGESSRSTSASAGRSRSWRRSPQKFPDAAILVTGVEDPDTRAHGANESLHLGEFERVCVAEAVLLERLGSLPR